MSNSSENKQDLANFVYDKTYKCPVCEVEFKNRTVRQKSIRLVSTESDLRSIFTPIDPVFYEAIVCLNCGYAALPKAYEFVTQKQADAIRETISKKYVQRDYPTVYDEDTAIERLKLAYLTASVKKSRDSEKAYICLKMAWVYRSKGDEFDEAKYMKMAYDGFAEAISKEHFPILEFDEPTLSYLMGELARRLGQKDDVMPWFSRVISNRDAKPRLKELVQDAVAKVKAEK